MTSLHITMPDGSIWAVPTPVIAADYARCCSPRGLTEAEREAEILEMPSALVVWARTRMTWEQVAPHVRCVSVAPPVDYARGWEQGEMRVGEEA